jgi:hypothetical protein
MSDASQITHYRLPITHYRSRITPEGDIYPKNQIKCNIFKAHVFSLVGNWMLGSHMSYSSGTFQR